MVKPIVKDILFLGQKSDLSTEADKQVAVDLRDTLAANRAVCVGMAANMIGYKKRTIIVSMGIIDIVMHNPEIISKAGEYEAEEGCLSLVGTRKTTRYKDIEVKFQDESFNWKTQKFSGFTAQIVQHEVDHLDGIII